MAIRFEPKSGAPAAPKPKAVVVARDEDPAEPAAPAKGASKAADKAKKPKKRFP
jgi:hypothetical protein